MPEPEILKIPPVEAIEHFRAKGFHVGFDWRDTAAAEHLRSFTVAKATRLDILEDIRGAVDEALAEGTTLRQFRARLEPVLREKGWWGRQRMLDPLTGKMRSVQLGSPRRLAHHLRHQSPHGARQGAVGTDRARRRGAPVAALYRGPGRTHPRRSCGLARDHPAVGSPLVADALYAERLALPLPGPAAFRR